ncbi:MAG: cupin domain-containing protein [Actinomycetes bacterium]
MNRVFEALAADLEWTDLPEAKCPEGVLNTGVAVLAETSFVDVGVWEHPRGVSTDVEADEVFVVLSGAGRVVLDDGTELRLTVGTVGVLAAGTATTWIIDEPLRKVWITPR